MDKKDAFNAKVESAVFDSKTKMVNLRFPETLLASLDRHAKDHFRSRSSVIFEACQRLLLENGKQA
jgi:hypothetical protein